MYKHILLPTDGSALSKSAMHACISLASETGARITALYVIPAFRIFNHETPMLAASKDDFVKDARLHAQQYLAEIEAAARDAGVRCDTLAVDGERPHEVIIKTAREQDCDLIAMASHGRRGAKAAMLGSETQKVLVYSHLPVLVYR